MKIKNFMTGGKFMSVCLNIYKVVTDVQYLGTDYEKLKLTKEERENIEELPDEIFIEKFSDGKKHRYLDLTMHKWFSTSSGKNRYWKKIKKMNLPYNTIITTYGYTYHATVVASIVYRQGWFLKNRFFKKKCTSYNNFNRKPNVLTLG